MIWYDLDPDTHAIKCYSQIGVEREVIDPGFIWTYAVKNPITKDMYNSIMKGGRWADEPERSILTGDNVDGLPTHEKMKLLLNEQYENWLAWYNSIGREIINQQQADLCANYLKKIKDLLKSSESQREDAARPYFRAHRDALSVWVPTLEAGKEYERTVASPVIRWENDKARLEANMAEENFATPPIYKGSGTIDKKMTLRDKLVVIVEDYPSLLRYFATLEKTPLDLINALNICATRHAKRPGILSIPGCKIDYIKRIQ